MLRAIFYIVYLLILLVLEILDIFLLKQGISTLKQFKRSGKLEKEEHNRLIISFLEIIFFTLIIFVGIFFFFFVLTGEVNIPNLTYTVDYNIGNCQIKDSYLIHKKNDMLQFIETNLTESPFDIRSDKSYLREWRAHNLLYTFGIAKESTASVDLNIDESFVRKIGYFILSLFYC